MLSDGQGHNEYSDKPVCNGEGHDETVGNSAETARGNHSSDDEDVANLSTKYTVNTMNIDGTVRVISRQLVTVRERGVAITAPMVSTLPTWQPNIQIIQENVDAMVTDMMKELVTCGDGAWSSRHR